jgi:methyl-accepting chemotaxis protein
MFNKTKTQVVSTEDKDMECLLAAMDKVIGGNYDAIDTSVFDNPSIGDRFNEVIMAFKKSNNNFVMRANEAMESIGDNSCSKAMMDQVVVQSDAIDEMVEASENLEKSIGDITVSVERIRNNTHSVLDVTKDSAEGMKENVKIVNESSQELQKINQQVQQFQEKILKIGEIVDVVKKVASMSNLLALNASIEAARAGEAGKGFAVVADQVRELSSSTSESADDIVKYVSELQEDIDSLAGTMNTTVGKLENGNDKVLESIRKIDDIETQMVDVSADIDSIYQAIDKQSEVTQNFGAVIQEMKASYEVLSENCQRTGRHIFKIGRYIDTLRSDMYRGFSQVTELDKLRIFEIDHFILTWRVYNNAVDFEHLKITQLNNPTGEKACKVGKWIQQQKDPAIANSQQFRELDRTHRDIHTNACKSWEAKEKGDSKAALDYFDRTMSAFQDYSKAIHAMMDYMKTLGYEDMTEIVVIGK